MVTALLTLAVTLASGNAYESRSPHYVFTVTQVGKGYNVRVANAENQVVFAQDVEKLPHEISKQVVDRHFVVELSTAPDALIAHFEVEQAGMVVDSIHTAWATAPRARSTGATEPLAVGNDVKAPIVLRRVEPKYTEEARRDGVYGSVILKVMIDKHGVVRDVTVLKPLPDGLAESAVEAMKQWTFTPGTLHGRPVDVLFNLRVNFKLDEPVKP